MFFSQSAAAAMEKPQKLGNKCQQPAIPPSGISSPTDGILFKLSVRFKQTHHIVRYWHSGRMSREALQNPEGRIVPFRVLTLFLYQDRYLYVDQKCAKKNDLKCAENSH